MASSSPHILLLLFLAAAAIFAFSSCSAATFGFDIHHRFSTPVRRWAETHGHPGAWWPEKEGTAEYYAALARHDRALHRRFLADSSSSELITFSDGNETFMFSSLGFLHYAFMELGTPRKRFLVALDTGSDLFWVPCDCVQCAPTTSPRYGKLKLNIYSPTQSTTSKNVPCTSGLCDLSRQCSAANSSSCPYVVQYLSANTSSSGTLVEDTLHLIRETATPEAVEASIVFGCGRVQTGVLLEAGAPNGLFGLGLDKISVPSILASKGTIASNSFSMCFGDDGYGRINFGDKGSLDQDETPFSIDIRHPSYFISITETLVGKNKSSTGFRALVDSGTSFAFFADPIYTQLATSFTEQVQEKRSALDPSIPFEYCYDLSPNQTELYYPEISFVTKGGSLFPVNHPYVLLGDQKENKLIGYCLAILKSDNVNIIGQNFMTGLRIVFDRERSVLGWKQFNCYNSESFDNRNSSSSPTAAPAPSSDNSKGASNKTIDALAPSPSGVSSHLNAMASIFLMLFLLVVAIL
ncbi:aspartyl protease family protein 1-like [Typha angustifolia]|uniref:aspartyl protease family protein 1-like n=1 Tax=Typha angustifolia TaxID=59011 RepID=UPI003C2F08E1